MKWNDPLKLFRNKLNMKNFGTKSVNMSDIMVYLAMFGTTIDKILCYMGPPKMQMSHYFLVLDPNWNLGFFKFLFPLLIFSFSETWDLKKNSDDPPSALSGPGPKFPRFLVWKASLIVCTWYCSITL